MLFSTITIVFMIVLLAGFLLLQIYLSGKENKWLGLILPFISFGYSIIMALSYAAYDGETGWHMAGIVFYIFFISNLPTLILLAIYWLRRSKIRRNKELEKMNLHDLG